MCDHDWRLRYEILANEVVCKKCGEKRQVRSGAAYIAICAAFLLIAKPLASQWLNALDGFNPPWLRYIIITAAHICTAGVIAAVINYVHYLIMMRSSNLEAWFR